MWSLGTSEAQSGLSSPTWDRRTPGQAAHHTAQVTQPFPGGSLPTVQGQGMGGRGVGGALFILNQQKTKLNKQQRSRMRQSTGNSDYQQRARRQAVLTMVTGTL